MAKKNMDLSSIVIEKLIIHDIPKRKKTETIDPSYSEQESDIADGMRATFKDKIVSALGSGKSFKICYDSKQTSPMSLYISELLANDSNFVAHSKSMANHLIKSQNGINAAGILLVILGKISDQNACIILKLERDKGVQLTRNLYTKSFDLQEVNDLMMTQKTKVFKVVLFIQRKDFGTKFDGILMDFQTNISSKKEISTFFMADFLGCIPYKDPKVSTQSFYNYTRTFIDTIEDEITRAKYAQHLNSYIQKNQNTICPKEFADDYLETSEHKDSYKKYLKEKKFSFDNAYVKDTSLIDNKIKKITISFENDISIVGNKGILDDKVELIKLENGQHKAEIISKIKSIS